MTNTKYTTNIRGPVYMKINHIPTSLYIFINIWWNNQSKIYITKDVSYRITVFKILHLPQQLSTITLPAADRTTSRAKRTNCHPPLRHLVE